MTAMIYGASLVACMYIKYSVYSEPIQKNARTAASIATITPIIIAWLFWRWRGSHRAVVYPDVGGKVDELDELEAVVLAPLLVSLRCSHVVQVDALVHLSAHTPRRFRTEETTNCSKHGKPRGIATKRVFLAFRFLHRHENTREEET